MALMARMWLRWPCSSWRPSARRTPSEVPNSAASISCTPSALPLSSACTQPPRISARQPVHAAGMHHHRPRHHHDLLLLLERVCRTSAAVCRTAVSTWRSEEMPLAMKANASRSRSFDSGTTRMPRSPTTIRSPRRRSRSRRQHGAGRRPPRSWRPCAGSPLRSTCWPLRTKVRWLVVE